MEDRQKASKQQREDEREKKFIHQHALGKFEKEKKKKGRDLPNR